MAAKATAWGTTTMATVRPEIRSALMVLALTRCFHKRNASMRSCHVAYCDFDIYVSIPYFVELVGLFQATVCTPA